jgi:hypothetical protein
MSAARTLTWNAMDQHQMLQLAITDTQGLASIAKDQVVSICQTFFDIVYGQYSFLRRYTAQKAAEIDWLVTKKTSLLQLPSTWPILMVANSSVLWHY